MLSYFDRLSKFSLLKVAGAEWRIAPAENSNDAVRFGACLVCVARLPSRETDGLAVRPDSGIDVIRRRDLVASRQPLMRETGKRGTETMTDFFVGARAARFGVHDRSRQTDGRSFPLQTAFER